MKSFLKTSTTSPANILLYIRNTLCTHRCKSLPLTTVRKDFFDDVLVPVKVTESSSSGGSANERCYAISVQSAFRM